MHVLQDKPFRIYVSVSKYNGGIALVIRRVLQDPKTIQLFLDAVFNNNGLVVMYVPQDKATIAALKLIQLGIIKKKI